MRYVGCIRSKKAVESEAAKVAKDANKTVVIEKAKAKTPGGKWVTCYRAWVDLKTRKAKVITYDEWKKKKG